ncbi:MAG: transketolase [Clostridiaceae bacterium]|nr:transketolase [Clostridiaceae bacterium]
MKNNMQMDLLGINAIRALSIDAIQKANSGHPGMPLGAAPVAFELWANHMKHNPSNPNWFNRDRFILSAGHASMLMYSLLHLFGYGLTADDLAQFRQWGSKTPGHPEYLDTEGVEMTTGPLGQGIASAVGFAIAEAHLASRFNTDEQKIIDHYTYVLSGDGCLMEGVSCEASSLAGHLKLDKLILFYDRNKITIEGSTDLAFTEDVAARYKAYGWQVLSVADANDTNAIAKAIEEAKANKEQPTIIILHSNIGYGSPLVGSESTHGSPLGDDNILKTKEYLGWDKALPALEIPQALKDYMVEIQNRLSEDEKVWNETFAAWQKANPELAKEFAQCFEPNLEALENDPALWSFSGEQATRKTSSTVLNVVAKHLPGLIGGSADLAPSNNTDMPGLGYLSAENYSGRNIHYGIREFAMGCIVNGMNLHGGVHAFGATFFVFADYIKPAFRLASLMNVPSLFILTHDSIGVGEDGPTHQPIEQLSMLRATPNTYVFRPADGKETAAAYLFNLKEKKPTFLALTRQNLPTYEQSSKDAIKGGYIFQDCEGTPELIILASGSEVKPALEAQQELIEQGKKVRVVSMPCMDAFLEQDTAYQEEVLPSTVTKRISIEAGSTMPWYRLVGSTGKVIGIDHFGASAPASILFEEFGINKQAVLDAANELL